MSQKVKPEVLQAFLKQCVSIRTFESKDPLITREHSLSVNLGAIRDFYITRIGVPPLVTSLDEIQECLQTAIRHMKRTCPDGFSLIVRLFGECKPWLAIKVYTMLVYECDRIVYGGDMLIKL